MASPVKVDGSHQAAADVAQVVSCRHGVRWVVDVATGRVLREPCAVCGARGAAEGSQLPTGDAAGR